MHLDTTILVRKAQNKTALDRLERIIPRFHANEVISYAKNTPLSELAEVVIPDRDGAWAHPVWTFTSKHITTIGAAALCQKTLEYIRHTVPEDEIDIFSVSSGIQDDFLVVTAAVRTYKERLHMKGLYKFLGEDVLLGKEEQKNKLIVPDDALIKYTAEERKEHEERLARQNSALCAASEEAPFLNSIRSYERQTLPDIDESRDLIYDLLTVDKQTSTILKYEAFIGIFRSCMQYITSVEKDTYYGVLGNEIQKDVLTELIESHIKRNYIDTNELPQEDFPALMRKINRALFDLYVIQDLIDDDEITDIKVTAHDSIRVRVKGKAYISNVTFIDEDDYLRFIRGIAVRNGIDLDVPTQTFTDSGDPRYILRFSITAPYVSGTGDPIIHIRKLPRKKLMADDLIKAGMMDEKIRDYLLDCGKHSRGVVFAGPPGSGKTVCMNWFLEDAYEASAEILVIQENDELFAYRKGVMFEHVVTNPGKGELPCSLEELGQMALVAGANVFVIGEAKGAEICSAITLSNSGCRTALTIHSQSSTETIDKMADLAMRGYATSFDQAKRMIKSFQTIVYLQDFKVQEISEIIGYDDKKRDMIYRPIYRRN